MYAYYMIGMCYLNGNGVTKSSKEALKYFDEAATNGLDLAEYELGLYYYNPENPDYNLVKAFGYFEFASNQDFPPAVLKLSECYLFGNGIEKNLDYAKELAKKAISLNAFGSKEFLKNNF